jgi:hypothetical protein
MGNTAVAPIGDSVKFDADEDQQQNATKSARNKSNMNKQASLQTAQSQSVDDINNNNNNNSRTGRRTPAQQSSQLQDSARNDSTRPRSGGRHKKQHAKPKGINPQCQSEIDLSLGRLCINLCSLVQMRKETERDAFVATVFKETQWNIKIAKIIKVPNYNFFFRKRHKPCVMVGTVSNTTFGGMSMCFDFEEWVCALF